jgi:hypothetical protein
VRSVDSENMGREETSSEIFYGCGSRRRLLGGKLKTKRAWRTAAQTLQSGATVRQAVSAIEDLSWKKRSPAYAVCRFFFKDQNGQSRAKEFAKWLCL